MIDTPHQDKGLHNANLSDFDTALNLAHYRPNLRNYDVSYVQWSEGDALLWRLARSRHREEHERLRQLESDLAHVNRLSILGELASSLAHEITQPIASARNNARAA